jgi:hypothetical protein
MTKIKDFFHIVFFLVAYSIHLVYYFLTLCLGVIVHGKHKS